MMAGAWLAFAPVPAPAEDAGALARALAAVGASDWARAGAEAAASGPLAEDIVAWHRLRAGRGDLAEFLDFATRNADWPGMPLLLEKAEGAISAATPAAVIRDWFAAHPPLTGRGALAWLAALPAPEAEAQARALWAAGLPLSEEQEALFLNQFVDALTESDHESRTLALLAKGEAEAARRVIPRTGLDFARLASLRADIQTDRPGWQTRFRALHAREADDAGLAHDRFRALIRARDRDAARALMLDRSHSAEALGDPSLWAGMRADYARLALREGDPRLAHRLAEGHHLQPGDRLWPDLTFLAGYAALKSGDPAAALAHFRRLGEDTRGLLSQSRALYWQARAQEAAADPEARATMTRAAAHQASFYGQLAAESLSLPMDAGFLHEGDPAHTLPDWRDTPLREDSRFQAAIWLQLAGAGDLAARFLNHMAETAAAEDIGRMARLMTEFGQTHAALRLAKTAAAKGITYPDALYPLPGLDHPGFTVPEELVLAIARQESEFNPRAGSHVGARGLMQVMPATAQDIARQTGMDYDLARLSTEAGFNARFGAYYLRQLRDRFGPSVALVAAGYNAGPGRAGQWLDSLGDIRGQVDPVDWVEMIPFDETRNYVMRVAEALAVYRARLSGTPAAFTLRDDLSGGGVRPPPPGPRQTIPFTLTRADSPVRKGLPPGRLPDPATGPR